uniref:ORF43 n=1 Tax=Latid herpesvirus 1 TaxID=3096545 RepID=A0AB33V998_9VIRU
MRKMNALGKNLGGDALGGFHDMGRFETLMTVRPLLPVIQGPENRVICSMVNDRLKTIEVLLPEHFGYFLNPTGTPTELRKLIAIAKGVLEDVSSDAPFVYPMGEPSDAVGEGATEDMLGEARNLLDRLVAAIPNKKVKLGGAKKTQTVLATRLSARNAWMPHTTFEELAQVYCTVYWDHYKLSNTPHIIAAGFHLDDAFPLETTKRVLTPLFVEKLLKEEREIEVEGETVVTTTKYLTFRAFKGFLMEVNSKGEMTQWDGKRDDGTVTEAVMGLDKTFITEALTKLGDLQRGVAELGKINPVYAAPAQAQKLRDSFFMTPERMNQPMFVKLAKTSFQSDIGIGVLQTLLRTCVMPWSVTDAPGITETMSDYEILDRLRQGFATRFDADLTLLNSSKTPLGALGMRDVGVNMEDRYWTLKHQPKKDSTETDNSMMLNNIPGNTMFSKLLNELGGRYDIVTRWDKPNKIFPQTGLWSVYNSSEFTEFGTLAPPQVAGKAVSTASKFTSCTDLSDFSKFKYIVKLTPAAPPSSVIILAHQVRLSIFGALGYAICSAGQFSQDETIDTELGPTKAMITVTKECCDQFLRGFSFNYQKEIGSAMTSFELNLGVNSSKGRAIYNKSQANRSVLLHMSNYFKGGIEWLRDRVMRNTALVSKLSKTVKGLLESYDVREMIIEESRERPIYYLRPFFMTPFKSEIPTISILTNKQAFNNSPFLLNTNNTVVTIPTSGTFCTVPMAPVFNSWDTHNVYGIVIENNARVYSVATRERWSKGGSGGRTMVTDDSIESLINSLLGQTCEGDPVTSADLNMFELEPVKYEAVKARLEAMGRYLETEPPVFGDGAAGGSAGAAAPEPPSCELNLKQYEDASSKKRAAAATLGELWTSEPTKRIRIEGDE